MVSNEKWFGASAGFYPETIDQSARFNDDDNAYLNDTSPQSGNRRTFTISFWFKRSTLGTYQALYSAGTVGNYFTIVHFHPNDTLYIQDYASSVQYTLVTNQVFRDITNWYHMVIAYDTTQATASNRIKLYINGSQVTSFSTETYPSQNYDTFANSNITNNNISIGAYSNNLSATNYRFDGYLAEYNLIDGTALTPSSFGESKNGTWVPIAISGLTYGTNGFRLTFADSSNLGDDTSGNGNDFAVNGLASTDVCIDSPTNNFCTMNSLQKGAYVTLSEGNLQVAGNSATNSAVALGTFSQTSGKWYFEVRQGAVSSEFIGVMVKQVSFENSLIDGSSVAQTHAKGVVARYNGLVRGISGELQLTSTTTWTTGDIIGIAFDMDNGAVYFAKNNTYLNSGNPTSGSSKTGSFLNFTVDDTRIGTPALDSYTGGSVFANFGSDSSFGGNATAQGNTDENGKGDFYYTPPSGYLALCSANLPDITISANEDTQANNHFNTVLYTGNGSTQSITGVGFQPDWVWLKGRDYASNHRLTNSTVGVNASQKANTSDTEDTNTTNKNFVVSFDSDGFGLNSGAGDVNQNTQSFVSWNWKGGGTTPSKTYKVVVVSDSGNKFRFRNSSDTATFAQSAVTLNLQELGTYTFDVSDSSMSGHALKFSTTSDGIHGGGSEYTTGETSSGTSGQSGAYVQITVASSAPTLYYYCGISGHSGMGGQINTNTTHGSTNFDGSILSVVQTNETSKLSILTYTGNDTAGATIGHGLGVKPAWILIKRRTGSTQDWIVYHHKNTSAPATEYLMLNRSDYGTLDSDVMFNDTEPDTSVITLGSHNSTNQASQSLLAYVFAEVDGYSRFGSYTGNSSSDGTFVFTGFRPAWLMVRKTTGGDNWLIHDSVRDPDNVVQKNLLAETSSSEGSDNSVDFLSNGFKWRVNSGARNTSGQTYVYMAFAKQSFKFSNSR